MASSLALVGAALPSQLAASDESSLPWIVVLSVLLVVCLVLRAFYAGSETALVSLNKPRIERLAEVGDKKAQIIMNLASSPERMLGMTLVGTNLMSVVIAQISLLLVWALLQASAPLQFLFVDTLHLAPTLIAAVLTTVLVLIFGEVIPKTIFRLKANQLALRYAYALRISDVLLSVGTRFVSVLTSLLINLMGKDSQPVSPEEARAELRLLTKMGELSGNILSDERRMIHSVLNLHQRTVVQVMRPLVNIVAVKKDTGHDQFLKIASEAGHSRIPVYEERIFNIVGIVNLLDVIYSGHNEPTIQPFIRRDVQFVPETKPTNTLLKEMQRSSHTMAFVVDEYGGVVGLVTIEDLVEEIVGEVTDERDAPDHIRQIGPRMLECDGRAEVDILSDRFGIPIPLGNYETISGYVLNRMGLIPKTGEQMNIDEHFAIVISEANSRGIQKLCIQCEHQDFVVS